MFKPNLYFTPVNYDELYDVLEKYPDNSRIIGGGTTIYELAHKGLLSDINVLIDLKNLNLINIIKINNSLKIETSATFNQMENDSILTSSTSYSSIIDSSLKILLSFKFFPNFFFKDCNNPSRATIVPPLPG